MLLATTLTGCEPEIRIDVESAALPRPVFRLSMDGEEVARFTEGTVQRPDGSLAWSFRATVPGVRSGASELVYGEPPEGFETLEGPAPLGPGLEYILSLEGRGRGQKAFTPYESP